MKAAVFQKIGQPLKIAEIAKPSAQPGELVFAVKASGICASDLHAAEVGMIAPGTVIGHEFAGEVVEVGAGVTGWQVGDRLTALPVKPCGICEKCQAKRFLECGSLILQGFDSRLPGAYAEYATCLAALALKLPASLDVKDAALIEPLAVGLGAWKAAAVPTGASVLIIGAGIIGLAVAKWARFFGATVVGVSEMQPARIERARQMGVDLVIDASRCPNPVIEFEKQAGHSPAVIFECVGKPIIDKLIEMAPINAQLVLVGAGMQADQFTVFSATLKRLRMTFAFGYEPGDFPYVVKMLETGRITTRQLVTRCVGLDEVPVMFESLKKPNDHCKVLITP
ncbi:MAG: alcohol dehydrogenase catalytic domain-containing protein [Proteobacteria bacterium]|nr:alcohol dehydrogenase catalytic domain-containing protein [Pseudomonadota bacterium]